MLDSPVRLPDHKVDELFRASVRCTEEAMRSHRIDGVEMVVVPEGIFDRLRSIVMSCMEDAGEDWRP